MERRSGPGARRSKVAKEAQESSTECIHTLGFTFPDRHHFPSDPTKFLNAPLIPFDVSAQLQRPITDPRLGNSPVFASLVLVPKTTVDKDDLSPSREYQIGRSRQGSLMKNVTVSEAMQKSADNEFWLRVFSSNLAHDLAASCWRDSVHRLAHEVSRYNHAIGSQSSTTKWRSAKRKEW
jgi:hypothetical protein